AGGDQCRCPRSDHAREGRVAATTLDRDPTGTTANLRACARARSGISRRPERHSPNPRRQYTRWLEHRTLQDEERADQLLGEALARDAGSGAAHLAIGMLRNYQNRLPEAKIELERAIALDRNDASAFNQLGRVLVFLGQPEAAIPLAEKAIRLDPQATYIHVAYVNLGRCHLLLDHIDEAID